MKKNTSIFFIICFTLLSTLSFAQLSTREDDQSVYKIGTRPVKGNFAYFIGVKSKDITEAVEKISGDDESDDALRYKAKFSVMNLKYYLNNSVVLRAGLDLHKKKRVVEAAGDFGYKYSRKTSDRYYVLNLGLEKHFSTKNFLDPYVGAEIYAGVLASNRSSTDAADNSTRETVKRGTSFLYGAGTFMGVQAFIADLPFSVGLEWGFLGLGYLGSKYKVESKTTTAGVTVSEAYYQSVVEDIDNKGEFSEQTGKTLKAKQFDLTGFLRVNFSYYFTK